MEGTVPAAVCPAGARAGPSASPVSAEAVLEPVSLKESMRLDCLSVLMAATRSAKLIDDLKKPCVGAH